MIQEMKNVVKSLSNKADTNDANEALKYSQAACNVSNALTNLVVNKIIEVIPMESNKAPKKL